MLGHGEVVSARTSPTLLPHPLALCCHYPVSKCPSASIVVTGTLRVKSCALIMRKEQLGGKWQASGRHSLPANSTHMLHNKHVKSFERDVSYSTTWLEGTP